MDFTLLDDISLELATVLEEISVVFRKRLKKQMKRKQGPLSYMHFFQKECSSATYLMPLLYNQENDRSTSDVNMQHVDNIEISGILLSNQLSKKTVEMEYVDKIGGLCSVFELKKGAVDKKALKITEDLTPNVLNIHISLKDSVSKIKSEQYLEEDATENKIIDKTEKVVKTVSDIVLKIIQNGEECRKGNSVSSSAILGSAIGFDDIVKKLGDAEDTVSEDKMLPIVLEKAVSHAETQDQKSLNDYMCSILDAITPFPNEQDHDIVPSKLEQVECSQEEMENIDAYNGAADLAGFIIDGLLEKATALTTEKVKSDSIESIQEDTDYGWIIPEVNSDSIQSLPEDPEYGWIVTPEIYPQYMKGLESPVPSSNNIYDLALFLVNEAVHQAHLIIQGRDKSEKILDQSLKTDVPDIELESCLNTSNLDLQNIQEELLGEQNKLIISPKRYPSYFDNEFWKKEMEEKSLDERFQEIQNSCCYGSRSNINLEAIEMEQLLSSFTEFPGCDKHLEDSTSHNAEMVISEAKALSDENQNISRSVEKDEQEISDYLSSNQEDNKNEIDGAAEERKSKICAFVKRVQQAGRRVLRIFRYSAKDKK